jgi:L-2-hydroxyglutarate oxidase LhgO
MSEFDVVDAVVIGAGVVGLAVARALALRGLAPIVVEAETSVGSGISSRNSQVIHAGLYHPPGSLKAELCVAGREMLYGFCESRGIAHRRLGKLVVATNPAELPALQRLHANALANGVDDLVELDAAQARTLEPALSCAGALLSPSTGIVDVHALMLALQADVEAGGGMVVRAAPVLGISCDDVSMRVQIGGIEPTVLSAGFVVNAAGLSAPRVASHIDVLDAACVPPRRFAKGNYFALSGRAPFSRLIYPLPHDGGLGVHLTLDLGGQARFGPDVEWLSTSDERTLDYQVDASRTAAFEADVRRFWPGLPAGTLRPDFSGVRPKLHGPGEAADFVIQGPREHGIDGLVNLFGIESPGLTACLAIAEEVVQRLDGDWSDD